MLYLYRLLKVCIWMIYIFVLVPAAWLLYNLVMLVWYMNFKHFRWVDKEEWEDMWRWGNIDCEWIESDGEEWHSVNREYYYDGPGAMLRNEKTYKKNQS